MRKLLTAALFALAAILPGGAVAQTVGTPEIGLQMSSSGCRPLTVKNRPVDNTLVQIGCIDTATKTFRFALTTAAPGDSSTTPATTEYVDRITVGRNAKEFGVLGYPASANDTVAAQAALTWLAGAPGRSLTFPAGTIVVDGLDLNGCNRCKLDASATTFLWSGTSKVFNESVTGITYPQSVLLLRGDVSVNQGGEIRIGRIDGWNLAADGLFAAAGYSHTIEINDIWFTRYAINWSPHQNYGSESRIGVNLIKHTVRGIYEAPSYLYRDFSPPKTNLYFFSHLTENTRWNVGIILDCKEYGIKRDAPSFFGSQQTGSNEFNEFNVGAIDCTDYYDRTVDPISAATPGYYKGGTPIQDPGASAPTYAGKTRPSGILFKSAAAAGAIDIRDDYHSTSTPTPVTSRSKYRTQYLGNTMSWLLGSFDGTGQGGQGLSRSSIEAINQDFAKWGFIRFDTFGGGISVNGVSIADAQAWTDYTPTVSCQTGTITTLGTATARWKRIGKTLNVNVRQPITTIGSCAGYLVISLPSAPLANTTMAGRAIDTGFAITGIVQGGQTALTVQRYDGTFPSNAGVNFSMSYELP